MSTSILLHQTNQGLAPLPTKSMLRKFCVTKLLQFGMSPPEWSADLPSRFDRKIVFPVGLGTPLRNSLGPSIFCRNFCCKTKLILVGISIVKLVACVLCKRFSPEFLQSPQDHVPVHVVVALGHIWISEFSQICRKKCFVVDLWGSTFNTNISPRVVSNLNNSGPLQFAEKTFSQCSREITAEFALPRLLRPN